MSANILQSYLIKLGVQADKKGLDGFVGSVAGGLTTLAKFGAAAVGAFGLVQAGVMKLASSESQLKQLSDQVGVSAESIERMGYVASQMDSSTEAMRSSLEGVSRMAGAAALGMAKAEQAFATAGVKIRDNNGDLKDAVTLMREVGEGIKGKSLGEQKVILGRLGIDRSLIKTLTQDTTELQQEFDAMAHAAGVDFKASAQAGADLMDELGKAGSFTHLIVKGLGGDLMRDLTDGIKWARRKITENLEDIKNGINAAVRVINAGATLAGRLISQLAEGFIWLHKKTEGLSTVIAALSVALLWLGAPFVLIGAAIAGIGYLIDDLLTALEGGKSYFDWSPWLGYIKDVGQALDKLGGNIKTEFLACLQEVKNWLGRVGEAIDFETWSKGLPGSLDLLWQFIGILTEIGGFIAGAQWSAVKTTFGIIGDAIVMVIKVIKDLAEVFGALIDGDISRAFSKFKDVFKDYGEFIEKTIGRVIDLLDEIITKVDEAGAAVSTVLGIKQIRDDAPKYVPGKARANVIAENKNDGAPNPIDSILYPNLKPTAFSVGPSIGNAPFVGGSSNAANNSVVVNQTVNNNITGIEKPSEIIGGIKTATDASNGQLVRSVRTGKQ